MRNLKGRCCEHAIRRSTVGGLALFFFVAHTAAQDCTKTAVGFIPLIDLRNGFYQGKQGGLYPKGSNTRPPAHEAAGLKQARAIRPLDSKGAPDDANGKIVFVSIGMSNTTMEFSTFKPLANADPDKNPKVVIVDCAQGGMTAARISNLADSSAQQYWQTADKLLAAAGVTPAQVQAAWVKEANADPTDPFPTEEIRLQAQLGQIAQILAVHFPNIRVAYLSSRIYGGYAMGPLNPEPFAYQGGFSVKWLIESQINGSPDLNYDPAKGAVKAPWLSWGPYLWADGLKPRSDGLTYACSDLSPQDGTHPWSPGAREKVAHMLLDFLKTDSTARLWFLKPELIGSTSLFFPSLVARHGNVFSPAGTMMEGVAVANLDSSNSTLTFTAFDQSGVPMGGSEITNPQSLSLAAGGQLAKMDYEVFGDGIPASDRGGWFKVDSTARSIVGFFEVMDGPLSLVGGVDASSRAMSAFVIPDLEEGEVVELHVANPTAVSAAVSVELLQSNGTPRAQTALRTLPANGILIEGLSSLFPGYMPAGTDYLRITASQGMASFALLGKPDEYIKALNGLDLNGGATVLYSPQYAVGGNWRTTLSVVNLDPAPGTITLELHGLDGKMIGSSRSLDIPAEGKIQIDAQDFFVTPGPDPIAGHVVITSDGIQLTGSVAFGDAGRSGYAAALPLVAELQPQAIFSQLAANSDWYTGLAIVNPNQAAAQITVTALDASGASLGSQSFALDAGHAVSQLITQYIPSLAALQPGSGYIRVTSDQPIACFAVYGSQNALSALPPQVLK